MTLSESFGFAAGGIPKLFAMSVVVCAIVFALAALFFIVTHASRKTHSKKAPYALGRASSPGSAKDIVTSSNKKMIMRLDDDDDYKGSSSSSSSFFSHSGGGGGSGSSSCGGGSDSGGGGGGGGCGGD